MPDLKIDTTYKITWVSDDWDEFAQSNETPELSAQSVVGKLLFSFVADDITRMFYDVSLLQAQTQKKPYLLHYRCDAPGVARLMSMQIDYVKNEGWSLQNRIHSIKAISKAVYFEYAENSPLQRCSICNRINIDGEWQDLLHRPKILGSRQKVYVKYTACQPCRQKLPS